MMKGYHASTLTSGKDPLGSSAPVGDLSEARSTGRTRLRFRLDRSPPLLGPASALEFSMVVDGERELYPPAGELHTSHAVRSFCPAECVEWNCVVFWNKRGAPHHAPTTNSQIGCDLAFTKQDPLTGQVITPPHFTYWLFLLKKKYFLNIRTTAGVRQVSKYTALPTDIHWVGQAGIFSLSVAPWSTMDAISSRLILSALELPMLCSMHRLATRPGTTGSSRSISHNLMSFSMPLVAITYGILGCWAMQFMM